MSLSTGLWVFLPPLLPTRLMCLRSPGDQVPGVEDDPSRDEAFSMWSTATAHRIYGILSNVYIVQCVEFFYQVDNST